jgi:hypothetical protein
MNTKKLYRLSVHGYSGTVIVLCTEFVVFVLQFQVIIGRHTCGLIHSLNSCTSVF